MEIHKNSSNANHLKCILLISMTISYQSLHPPIYLVVGDVFVLKSYFGCFKTNNISPGQHLQSQIIF